MVFVNISSYIINKKTNTSDLEGVEKDKAMVFQKVLLSFLSKKTEKIL